MRADEAREREKQKWTRKSFDIATTQHARLPKWIHFFFYYSYAPFTSRFNPFGRVFNNNEVGSIREKNRNMVVVQAPLGDSSTVQLKRY